MYKEIISPSLFNLENYTRVNNEFCISDNQFNTIDVGNDNVVHISSNKDVDIDHLNIRLSVNMNDDNTVLTIKRSVDISQQEMLNKRFSKLTLAQSDEIDIHLFHVLKVINAPLVLLDRVINWIQMHKGIIPQHDPHHLMKLVFTRFKW